MLSEILGALAGNATEVPETWDRFSNSAISGDWDDADWREVFARARRLGVSFEDEGDAVVMWKGRSQGRFLNTGV